MWEEQREEGGRKRRDTWEYEVTEGDGGKRKEKIIGGRLKYREGRDERKKKKKERSE